MAQAALTRTRIDVGKIELFSGTSYLVDPSFINPYELYASTLKQLHKANGNAKGICISTAHPSELKSSHGIENAYWLSSVMAKGNLPPTSPSVVLGTLVTGLADSVDLALLDGVEYMSEFNDPHTIYQMISEVRETVASNGKIFILPLMEEALLPKYGALYRRTLEVLDLQ